MLKLVEYRQKLAALINVIRIARRCRYCRVTPARERTVEWQRGSLLPAMAALEGGLAEQIAQQSTSLARLRLAVVDCSAMAEWCRVAGELKLHWDPDKDLHPDVDVAEAQRVGSPAIGWTKFLVAALESEILKTKSIAASR